MPAVTSPRSYPYPLDGDPINVAGDIQKLAMKIDDDVTANLAASATSFGLKYDKAGGTVSGAMQVNGATTHLGRVDFKNSGQLYLSATNARPAIAFVDQNNGEGWGEIYALGGDLRIASDNDLFFYSNNAYAFGLAGTNAVFLVGKSATDSAVPGVEIGAYNDLKGRITSTVSDANAYADMICRHVGAMDAAGKFFITFQRGTTAVSIGTIAQVGTSGVAYNETSDYRLKDDLGPIEDPVGKIMALAPKHLRWKSDGLEYDGFLAHEVATAVPGAVMGEKDAVRPADDEFEPGGIDPQQLAMGRLIPVLVAALQDALTRIAELEAAS